MSTGLATAAHPAPTAPPTEANGRPRRSWIHISRAIYAVAELGIADLLAAGPLSSAELSRATDTPARRHSALAEPRSREASAYDAVDGSSPGTRVSSK